jgi:hypothetical protein
MLGNNLHCCRYLCRKCLEVRGNRKGDSSAGHGDQKHQHCSNRLSKRDIVVSIIYSLTGVQHHKVVAAQTAAAHPKKRSGVAELSTPNTAKNNAHKPNRTHDQRAKRFVSLEPPTL